VSSTHSALSKIKIEENPLPKETSVKILDILMLLHWFLKGTRSCKQKQQVSVLYWKNMHTKSWFIS